MHISKPNHFLSGSKIHFTFSFDVYTSCNFKVWRVLTLLRRLHIWYFIWLIFNSWDMFFKYSPSFARNNRRLYQTGSILHAEPLVPILIAVSLGGAPPISRNPASHRARALIESRCVALVFRKSGSLRSRSYATRSGAFAIT